MTCFLVQLRISDDATGSIYMQRLADFAERPHGHRAMMAGGTAVHGRCAAVFRRHSKKEKRRLDVAALVYYSSDTLMQTSASNFQVNPSSGVPIYRQLMDQVRALVAGGRLAEGDLLPSVRQVAQDLQVNQMTVSKAYSLLERDGVVRQPEVASGNDQGTAERAAAAVGASGRPGVSVGPDTGAGVGGPGASLKGTRP
jgi:hypothetical protein